MTREEIIEYGRTHQKALLLRNISANDYISARCLINNGLIAQGHILAQQAIEKILKSFLLFLKKDIDIRKFKPHRIKPLIDKVIEIGGYELDKFIDFGIYLSDTYELSRYPDSKLATTTSHWTISGENLSDIDEMYTMIDSLIPIPVEIREKNGVNSILEGESILSMNSKKMAYY